MSENNKVVAEARESFGKGAARKIRAAGKIPAVIYGHGSEPRHITLPAHQVGLILRKANALLELEVDGKTELALVKDVQKDPVRLIIEHIDLIVIKKGEKVQVEVPVHLIGESFPGTISELDVKTLHLEAPAIKIPENVVIDISGLEEGAQIHAKDVTLPEGANLLTDEDAIIVSIHTPQKADEDDETAESSDDAPAEAAE